MKSEVELETLHIRRGYLFEGDKRWAIWSAVQIRADGEQLIAASQPLREWSGGQGTRLRLTDEPETALPTVAQYEFEQRLQRQGRSLVEKLEMEGWQPVAWDENGQATRMQRAGK